MNPITVISLPLDTIILVSLYFVLGVYAIFSAILYYHWQTYTVDDKVSSITLMIYSGITVPLLLIMAITAVLF